MLLVNQVMHGNSKVDVCVMVEIDDEEVVFISYYVSMELLNLNEIV